MKKIFIILAAFCALTSCTQVQSDTKHLRRATISAVSTAPSKLIWKDCAESTVPVSSTP